MTEQELISKLQSLKKITPSRQWAFSLKMQLLDQATPIKTTPAFNLGRSLSRALATLTQPKLAYAFAVMLFAVVGTFGFAQYTLPGDMLFSVKRITEQSQLTLNGESEIKNSVQTYKKRSQDLAAVVKNNKQENKQFAIQEVNDAAKSLTEAIAKDPALAKDVALELKQEGTFAVIEGGADVKESSDILYKTIDEQMISDIEKTTLTESQKKIFQEVKNLFAEEKYAQALEKIFTISN